ncbi:MAG: autotransporter outer membrane beta-barrel domain-containing protein [Pseudomonadota bacterium]
MNIITRYSRRCVRSALLASTGLTVISPFSISAHAQTTVEETAVELTRRSDVRSLVDVGLDETIATNVFGLTPNLFAIGVDGDFGNDRITLDGVSVFSGAVDKTNNFSLLPSISELLNLFPQVSQTRVDVYGVEGGYGANTLRLQGELTVNASASAVQDKFDLALSTPSLTDLVPLTLESGVAATALGMQSTRGRSNSTNAGALNVNASAIFERLEFDVDQTGFDLSTSSISADSLAIGLAGDRFTDRLTNSAGATIAANADSVVDALDISFRAAKIVAAGNAAQARGISAGMDGGQGNDQLSNAGVITANASSTFDQDAVEFVVKELSPPSSLLPESEAKDLSLAVASGMDGGLGADRVTNTGAIALNAIADFDQLGVAISDGGISGDAIVTVIDNFTDADGDELEEALAEGAIAEIVGLRGDARGVRGGGADILTNSGVIDGTARADSNVASVSIGLPLSEVYNRNSTGNESGPFSLGKKVLDVFGVGLLDYSSDAAAFADGVRGGAGNDRITNSGAINVAAETVSQVTGVSAAGFDALADPDPDEGGEPLSVNATVLNASANAVLRSTGLSGGEGGDDITNGAVAAARADADAISTEVGVAFAIEDKALQIETPIVLSRTDATAIANGIDAGDGFDNVANNGVLTSNADAFAQSTDVTVGFSLVDSGGGVNAAIIDKEVNATAAAVGIRDGLGSDTVNHAGIIDANATSTAHSTSVGVDVTVTTTKGLAVTSGLAKANQTSTARAFGVERIVDDQDADASFTSTGIINSTATAQSTRTAVSADLAFSDKGLSIAAPIISNENKAIAEAGALVSFEADDVFDAVANMTAVADADALSTAVGVGGAVSAKGVAAGVSAITTTTQTEADSTLLSFGEGMDKVTNGAVLLADADATTRSNEVGVAIGAVDAGLALGAALVDSAALATADAITIETGDDADHVVNDKAALFVDVGSEEDAEIKADAFADVSSTTVNVDFTGAASGGVAIGAALARSSLVGDASATAVDLGAGMDQLDNADLVTANAFGKAKTELVNVALTGTSAGIALSGAVADTSVASIANAIGADGGADGDVINNDGSLTSDATAGTNVVGVVVSGSLGNGFTGGASAIFADATSNATAIGADGGEGGDTVNNAGDVTVSSNADTANTLIDVNVNVAPKGVSVGAAVVSAKTNATSDAVGLAGDADGLNEDDETTDDASEDDTITNQQFASVNATSRAEATSTEIGVNGQFIGFGGVALISDTVSNSETRGLFGGSGGDALINSGDVTTGATALGNGPSIKFNLVGANFGDLNTSANAFSYGLDGGFADDVLSNAGIVGSTATSTVSGASVDIVLVGASLGDMSTASNATAFGLFGGMGDDDFSSTGALTANSNSSATGTSVSVGLTGATFASLATLANSVAAGAAGGGGDNMFDISGSTVSTATANANSTIVSVNLVGAAFGDEADAGARAIANSYGYFGGENADMGTLAGAVTIRSTATAENDVAAATLAGASFGEMSPEAHAFSSLASGREGADQLTFNGSGVSVASATAKGSVTGVSVIGASSAKANPTAVATARGLSGDDGVDALTNTGAATVSAVSNVDVGRNRITVAGASIGSISSTSNANAAGVDGGDDNDELFNQGALTSTATASLDSDGVDVTVAGAGVDTGEGNLTARAQAAGMLGGDGEDSLTNLSALTSTSRANGSSGQVGVTVAGAGLADAKSVLSARSVGMDGEGDDDDLLNLGTITSTATVAAGNTNTSVVLLGASDSDTKADVTSTALLMAGGAGADDITNQGSSIATSTATGSSHNVEVTLAGALLGDAASKTTARVIGADAGSGDDDVFNTRTMDLNATATGVVGRVNVTVAGADTGASVETDILASGYGVTGGSGKDELINNALIDMDLSSQTNANSNSVVIMGASAVNAAGGLFSTSNGIGLKGDAEDDILTNTINGTIDIFSRADAESDDSSTNIFGAAAVNGLMRGRAWGMGLSGGSGADDLFNFGTIRLQATGIADSDGASFTAAGASNAGGDVAGSTLLYGMHGGSGDDFLSNAGTLTARSDARGTFRSSSLSAIGFSGGGGAAGADAWTYGFFGDSGLDEIVVGGTATSIADARVTLNSGVDVGIGAASSNRSGTEARAYGRGASGGADADRIEVTGALNTFGYAQISTSSTQFAFIGGSSGSTSATARAEAFAVNGDSGDDTLINNGTILADAESKNSGSGSAGTTFGSTNAASRLAARSNALGLYGGDGEDTLINNGTITGRVTTTTKSENTVTNAFLFSDGKAESRGTNNAFGTLFFDSQKDTNIVNTGDAYLLHYGNRDSNLRGSARAFAKSTGVTGSVNVNADSEARAYSNVNLRGVRLGDGSHTVDNSGEIRVEAQSRSSGAAEADGNSSISGDGNARGRAYVNNSTVTGVESLSGSVDFTNSDTLFVLNSPSAAASATGRGIGLDIGRDPDGRATATIEMNNVHAYGVRSGGFDDVIDNSGSITVESEPVGDRAIAKGGFLGGVAFSVDAFATATVNVNDAEAYGVHAGDGNNTIINSGSISVISDPYAEARAEARGRGIDGDVNAIATANALRAQAYGVITGDGNDWIENSGSISVTATPSRSRSTSVTVGEVCVIDTPALIIGGVVIIPAVEVCTRGEVDRNTVSGSTSATEVVINSGAGNDTLILSGSLNANGGTAINLGSGNDTLRLISGFSISGSVAAGSGSDTLELEGPLSYNATNQSFERFGKYGAGTASVTNTSVQSVLLPGSSFTIPIPGNHFRSTVIVEEGVLRFNGLANFFNTANLTTTIYGDGALGQFASTSSVILDGRLSVVANPDQPYVDGTTYDVVRGTNRFGTFGAVVLPTATALRSFTGSHTSFGYQVGADVETIVSVLSGATTTEIDFAQALDDATGSASGDVADTIAGLQNLTTVNDVQNSIAALTPSPSTTSLSISADVAATSTEATGARLAAFRANFTGRAAQPALGFSVSETMTTTAGATAWAANYGEGAFVPAFSNGLSGAVQGWTRGVDLATPGGALFGFAMTQLDSSGSLNGLSEAAAFTASTASVYATAPLSKSAYAAASVTWGESEVLNDPVGYAVNGEDGAFFDPTTEALEARFEAGRAFKDALFAPEVFGAVAYQSVIGGASARSSVLGPALNVQRGQAMQLESEFGVRMMKNIEFSGLKTSPHVALSWVARYGDGASVTATFADMPDNQFRLRSDFENRNAFRVKAGFNLWAGEGFELSASGVSETGDVNTDVTGELRAVVRF